jgi:hypothetical protein
MMPGNSAVQHTISLDRGQHLVASAEPVRSAERLKGTS